ncbi:MAG: RidA family protein [Alphaproteobacteria bacterium]
MSNDIESRLAELGIILPEVPAPVANYVPFVIAGPLVFISGQITMWDGELKFLGKVGADLTLEQGQDAARLCAINLLAQAKAAAGSLERIKRCVKLTGFVNADPGFTDHPKVINGASDLMVVVLGDNGRHARAAVGVNSLPMGVAVEVDGVFELS